MAKRLKDFDEMEIEMIKEANPSLCWSCKNSRWVHKDLSKDGFIGCNIGMKFYMTAESDREKIFATDLRTGFVDRHSRPFGLPSDSHGEGHQVQGCFSCNRFNE